MLHNEKFSAGDYPQTSRGHTGFAEGFSTGGTFPRLKPRQVRWSEEASFFDRAAEEMGARSLLLDPAALQRYQSPRLKRRFNKEFRFRIMGSLEGKRILDVGCGDGLNSVMLAAMGAEVTGIDISPKTIELARRRAEENGLADKVKHVCSPIEIADLPDKYFDLVWGDGVLHHLLDELDTILQRLHRTLKDDGLFVFAEPMNRCEPLRRLRKLVPVKSNGTPGERPLVDSEVKLVGSYTSEFHMRCFSLFGRLDRFILVDNNYERSPRFRRMLVNAINQLDYLLLSLPGISRLGGICVMYGPPAQR